MAGFGPIAVVGRACVLPGALSPAELDRAVRLGLDLLTPAPPGRWGLDPAAVLGGPPGQPDRACSDRGGYVRGFEQVWSPEGYRTPAAALAGLGPLFRWSLHAGREALAQAGHDPLAGAARCGVVLGNLSFPSAELGRFAEGVWRAGLPGLAAPGPVDPRNRFHSGLPAHLLAEALGLGGGAYCLDAACASALYAIKLACDRLHDGSADRMLAGAVNAADDLFLHMGFSALSALSPTGRSRPFHRGADGLVPAEGAVLFALERLEDAVRAGRRIYGVIRGAGLSNDGRGRTLLTPSAEGQVRALRQAYARAGLSPGSVSLLECHATGTRVGDAVELQSLAEVFAGAEGLPLGSLKSNLGHLITAAGGAALLKVLGAMEAGVRPPTLHAEEPNPALEGTPFRLLTRAEPWACEGPRRAGISAFGFGGNNAHLVVEEWTGALPAPGAPARARPRIAVVGLGARVAGGRSAADLAGALQGHGPPRPAAEVAVELEGLRTPPSDLEATLPQQVLMLEAAREALFGRAAPRERTVVLVGMGCDPEVARYGVRWRLGGWARQGGRAPEPAWLEEAKDATRPALTAAGVLGTMPNLVANRLSAQLDLAGPGFTVSSEEHSGLVALELAARALSAGEADLALVGAVDLSCEPVHQAALLALGRERPPGDAAVALALRREEDARAAGEPILALLGEPDRAAGAQPVGAEVEERVGAAHAAVGLLRVAAAVLRCARGEGPVRVEVAALGGQAATVVLESAGPVALPAAEPPRRALRLPAHPPPLRLPAVRLAPEHLPLPPALPPVLEADAAPQPAAPEPARPEPARPEQPAPVPPAAVPAPPLPAHRAALLPALAAHHQRLGEVHRAFLAQQAALQQRFSELTQRTLADALARRGAPRPALPAPLPPPAPVAAPSAAPAPVAAPPPVAKARAEAPPGWRPPVGPRFDRAQLEALASGQVSRVLGPLFERQDGFRRQVRMPTPPLLLADRVVGLDAEPGSMGTGTIWTETDVTPGAWYLQDGHVPAGVLIEAGQADLLLISWLGADFENRGERVYRLLGCELTYHGGLPAIGETLRYQIQVDGHARQGETRLFFFHSDCAGRDGQPRLSVRKGQAGFFSDAELADSAGVLWDPASAAPGAGGPLDPPAVECTRRALSAEQVQAFARGDLAGCFGEGFELGRTHVRTPGIPAGKMLLLDRVEAFEPRGGPWGRGYLKATARLTPETWFFDGHFQGDPCMPGTLMFEGCLQAMGIYLAGLGYTLRRDGWRFEPVPEEPFLLRCRGQATPASQELVYEVFVEEVQEGPLPTLRADLLVTVDGRKAFHARRVGLRLVPDWPLEAWRHLPASDGEQPSGEKVELASLAGLSGYAERPAPVVNGFPLDRASLLACAWGKPSGAFGAMYAPFDSTRRVPRLPGPPYHFITRIVRVEGELGSGRAGAALEVDYDLPGRAWYFEQNGTEAMPLAVLMEVVLQPCGWLASYTGFAVESERDLLFRNLDGKGTVLRPLRPGEGTLRTRTRLSQVSRTAGMAIVSFEVECELLPRAGGAAEPVFRLSTVFGFFPEEAFANQVGLPPAPAEQARRDAPDLAPVDWPRAGPGPARGTLRLPGPMLRMLERVDVFDPEGGARRLGYLRAHAEVRAEAWFFRAHFFQDPVQPGSLGVEACAQLLQFYVLQSGLAGGLASPVFETPAAGAPVEWKYRGQVVPANRTVTVEIEVTAVRPDPTGVTVVADAWLWADQKRIYQVKGLTVRAAGRPGPGPAGPGEPGAEEVLSLQASPWLADHRPTCTVAALPFTGIAERLARAALAAHPRLQLAGLEEVVATRWIVPDPQPVRLRTEVGPLRDGAVEVRLLAYREAATAALSRFEPVARGRVLLAEAPAEGPPPPAPPGGPRRPVEVYADGNLFHGPAFQLARRVEVGPGYALSALDASPGAVPAGALPVALLDAALHGIPHDRLAEWSAELTDDAVAYPVRLVRARFYGPAPTSGEVGCLAQLAGADPAARRVRFRLQLWAGARVWAELELEEALLPKGPLGRAAPAPRRAFLAERAPAPGVGLSRHASGVTTLREEDVALSNWLPGTLTRAYALTAPPEQWAEEIAVKEHVARLAGDHPAHVAREPDGAARSARWPLQTFRPRVERGAGEVRVSGGFEPGPDLARVRRHWDRALPGGATLLTDLLYGLASRFTRRVVVEDPERLARVRGRPALFLLDPGSELEPTLFRLLAPPLLEAPLTLLARPGGLRRLDEAWAAAPGSLDPGGVIPLARGDRPARAAAARALSEALQIGQSVLIPWEGPEHPWTDLALQAGVPVVPARFAPSLPPAAAPAGPRSFPADLSPLDLYLGPPLWPEPLQACAPPERERRVTEAWGRLGPGPGEERPLPQDPGFSLRAESLRARGHPPAQAVLLAVLQEVAGPCAQTEALLSALRDRRRPAAEAPGPAPLSAWLLEREDGQALD